MNTDQNIDLKETAIVAKDAVSRLLSKVKERVDSIYEEAKDKVLESNYKDQSLAESLAECIEEGYIPQLFEEIVKEAAGFDPFSKSLEHPVSLINKSQDAFFAVINKNGLCASIEVIDEEELSKSSTNHPEHKRYIAHVCRTIAEPVGVSKKNIYDGIWIYCTLYSDKFMFSKEYGSEPSHLEKSRLEDPSVVKSLFALHHSPIKVDDNMVDNLLITLEDRLTKVISEANDNTVLDKASDAMDKFYQIIEDHHDDDVLLVGDSVKTAVFKQFDGLAANVSKFYKGPKVFDLGYLLYCSGVKDDRERCMEVLYHYKVASSHRAPQNVEKLVEEVMDAADVISTIEEIEQSLYQN